MRSSSASDMMSQLSTNIQAVDELPSYAPKAAYTQVTVGQATVPDDSIYEDIDAVQQASQATDDSLYEDIDGVQDSEQQTNQASTYLYNNCKNSLPMHACRGAVA